MSAEYLLALPIVIWAIWLYMTAWFIWAVIIKRNDVADVAWGLGFGLATFVALTQSSMPSRSGLLVLFMVLIWGGRLSSHIYRRNRHKDEDYRYAKWREEWGKWVYVRSYPQVFMLQGLLTLCVATPALVVASSRQEVYGANLAIGFFIWLFGFAYESIADRQLRIFISKPHNKGKLMTRGLWKYSRHPNYFGEITQWWGLGVMAIGVEGGAVGLLGPAMITYLVWKVSGVPLLEKKYAHVKEYQEYSRRTSVIIPLPPK